jgi:hypothetical protein
MRTLGAARRGAKAGRGPKNGLLVLKIPCPVVVGVIGLRTRWSFFTPPLTYITYKTEFPKDGLAPHALTGTQIPMRLSFEGIVTLFSRLLAIADLFQLCGT